METLSTILQFLAVFGVLVFFHEFGHFLFAKRAGILCREFAIGFGPKIFAVKKGETLYTIRLLPIGGYVRMAGEDPEVIELKPGLRVGLLFNGEEKVKKIIVSGKDKYPGARLLEIAEADIERELFIRGYESEDDDRLKTYEVDREAVVVDYGQEIQIAPLDRQFSSKSLGKRALTIFAGPLFNFLLAFLVFMLIGLLQGVPSNDPVLGKLTEDGAALKAGLKEGDLVLSIDGEEVSTWRDVVEKIRANPEKTLEFQVVRDGKELTVPVVPEKHEENGETYGLIGVYNPVEKSPVKAFTYGLAETYFWIKQIFAILGDLIFGHFSFDMLSGPVGIYASTEEVAKAGFYYLLRWTALLSINLGIVNLLPFPALDGGRLLFFAIELIRGKPIDKQKEGLIHFIGLALLMLLMLMVTWNDIQRFFL